MTTAPAAAHTPPLPTTVPATGTFFDIPHRLWSPVLDAAAVARIRDRFGYDLAALACRPDGERAHMELVAIAAAPETLIGVMWEMCIAEATDRGVTFEDFWGALGMTSFAPDRTAPARLADRVAIWRAGRALVAVVAQRWPASPLAAAVRDC